MDKNYSPVYEAFSDERKAQIDSKIFLEIYNERQRKKLAGPFSVLETQKRVTEMRNDYAQLMESTLPTSLRMTIDLSIPSAYSAWRQHTATNSFPIDDLVAALDNLPPLDTHLRRYIATEAIKKGQSNGRS